MPDDIAPDFTLPVAGGDENTTASLSAHRGRGAVVLYFLRAFT